MHGWIDILVADLIHDNKESIKGKARAIFYEAVW